MVDFSSDYFIMRWKYDSNMNLDKPRREQFRKKYHYNISHIKEYVIIPNIE